MRIRFARRFGRGLGPTLILSSLLATSAARAVEPYASIELGFYFWPAYSNRNQVEADTSPGGSGSLALGVQLGEEDWAALGPGVPRLIRERLGARIEVAGAQRISPIHGVNDKDGQRTADGQTLYATSALANFWPSWAWGDRWRTYAGGGLGASWIRALGSDAAVFSVQTGAGVQIDVPAGDWTFGFDIGWRSLWNASVQLNAGRTDFDAHGAIIGISVRY